MRLFSAWSRWIIPALAIAFLAGCSFYGDERDETKEAHYQTGRSRRQSMDYKGAVEAFEKALEVNPQSSAAHLELGLLYAEKLNDGATDDDQRGSNFATAIYHLEKFIKLNPKSSWAVHVREQIKGCKYELAKSAPFTLLPNNVQAELERLNSTNTLLRQHVDQLKLQLAQQGYAFSNRWASLQAQTLAATNVAAAATQNAPLLRTNPGPADSPSAVKQLSPLAAKQVPNSKKQPTPLNSKPAAPSSRSPNIALARTHAVRRGETLASVARTHGTSLGSLMAANPGVDARKLRVGQILNLPGPKS